MILLLCVLHFSVAAMITLYVLQKQEANIGWVINKSQEDFFFFFFCERQFIYSYVSLKIEWPFFAQENLTLTLFWFMLADPLDYVYEKESTISYKQGLTMEVKWESTNRFVDDIV